MLTACGEKKTHSETNRFEYAQIGWIIDAPKDWELISDEDANNSNQNGAASLEVVVGENIDMGGVTNLLGIKKNNLNFLKSTIEPFELSHEEAWLNNIYEVQDILHKSYTQQGFKVEPMKMGTKEIDGLDFVTYGFTFYDTNGQAVFHQILFNKYINGFDFSINVNYTNEESKNAMLAVLGNSRFSD